MSTSSIASSAPGGAPVVSVASSGGAGAAGGSVINVSALVQQLVAAAQGPQESLIASQTQQVSAQISALGTLKSALSTFQSSLGALDTPRAFQLETASSSDPAAFTVAAGAGAPQGTYDIAITQLAQAQQLLSAPVAAGSALGSGTLTLSLGGTSFQVTVGATDTLADLAANIDSAAGNPGISATVLQGSDGAHLLLSSSLTGAASTIQVASSVNSGPLAALTYGSGNTGNYTQEAAAQDAAFSISGVAFTSPTNTVSNAISGVTLNLLSATAAGTPASFTVSTDTSSLESNISAFVSAYNTLHGTLAALGGYDAASGTAGPMMGNAALTGIQSQVQRALYSVVDTGSPTYNTLASIGITTQSDGTLSVNGATLAAALGTHFAAASQLWSGSAGVASTLNAAITTALGADGSITAAGHTLSAQENALNAQSNQLSQQMAALSASLTQQYAALNTLLSSLQSTSAYLSQAFATLPQVQSKQNA
ncbi:MAG TPA: flagellar filament capping protein FliD [Steroidobacteraceae bacterium]|nr:flagellar filament capping protein FliD [Steroidobacteraceae bacterium]